MYLIKSKSRNVAIKDGDQLVHVGPHKWVPFEKLPKALVELKDGSLKRDRDLEIIKASERNINPNDIEADRRVGPVLRSGVDPSAHLVMVRAPKVGDAMPGVVESKREQVQEPSEDKKHKKYRG